MMFSIYTISHSYILIEILLTTELLDTYVAGDIVNKFCLLINVAFYVELFF